MKKMIPFLLIALAVGAFWFRERWLPQPASTASYLGYVEGETLLISAPQAGRIIARPATKGASVRQGDPLFSLDPAIAKAALDQAVAAVALATAQRDDLLTGKRAPEIEVIRNQSEQVQAALALAQKELARAQALTASGTAALLRLDQAQTAVAQYKAQIAQLQASEAVAKLTGREAQIAAASAGIAQAEAQAAQARQKLADLSPVAPAGATIEDTYFDVGEWPAAGQPVISLLPAGNLSLRFFVPEADLAKAQLGAAVTFRCDGCGETLAATITHSAAIPEYTPPVVYSQGARAKLVYLVEAKPAVAATMLRPGLPIEVDVLP